MSRKKLVEVKDLKTYFYVEDSDANLKTQEDAHISLPIRSLKAR